MRFRLLCFGSHLAISFLIAMLSMILVFWVWYPAPLDKALGVESIFLLLLCIDVIVGPLLTFVVARQGKKTLKADLLTIGVIQLLALIYGLYTVAQGRPVWMIYNSDRFELVQAYEAVLSPSSDVFHLVLTGPIWGSVIDSVPESIGKRDAYYRSEFLQEYDNKVANDVRKHIRPLGVLKRFNDSKKVDAILDGYPDVVGFIPIAAKQKSLCVLIRKEANLPLVVVDLSPW